MSVTMPGWAKRATEDDIIYVVADFYGVKRIDMTRPVRHRTVARARMVAMFLLRHLRALSTPEIGWHVKRDHSTVLYGIAQVTRVWATDAQVQADIAELCRLVGASPDQLSAASAATG